MDASSRYKELILRAVIKCGLLRKILNTADLYYLLKFLPKGSVGRESRDIWRHVMKHAKDAGLLRDILEAAHRCGRVEEVVAGAVDGGFLDFHEEAEVARPIADGVEKCQSFEFDRMDIFRALTRPEVSIVQQKLVEQGQKDFVIRDVLEGAKQCEEEDLFCLFQHKWNLSAILTAAKEVGLLTNVLHAASKHGLLGKTLAAAKDAGLLTNLLHAASEHGLLGKTVAAAKDAGLLTNLLHAASEHGLLGKTVAAAKYYGLLNDVVHAASEHGLLGKTVAAAKDAGLLTNLLHAASEHGLLGKTVAAAKDAGLLTNLLHAASEHGLLGKTVAAAKYYGLLNDVVHAASEHGLLGKTLAAAKDAGLLTNLQHAASEHGLLGNTVAAKYYGLLNDVVHAASEHGLLGKKVTAQKEPDLLNDVVHAASEHGLLERTEIEAFLAWPDLSYPFTADELNRRLKFFNSSSWYAAWSHDARLSLDLPFAYWPSILHVESKIAFFSILIWLFLNSMTQRCLRLCGTQNAEHRKSVISQVTICSGDIERNPGPLFLNDWLKEMYSMLVRKWKGWQKKKIPWKQFGIPDPRNSRQDRDTLLALFQSYGLLTYCAIQDDSDIYTEEFQLLRVYINDREEPNIDQLDKIVRRRKLLVKFKELYGELSHLPESERGEVQRAVNNIHLQCVPFSGQGEQGAVQEQRDEDESDGANVEDEDEDRGAQIRDGPHQPDCPRGAVVANNEAAIPTSSTIEDSVPQSNGPSGNNPDDFWNRTLTDEELIQVVSTLLEEYPYEVRPPEGDSPPDRTPTDPASQSSGPKVTNDSDETMKDTPDVPADPQILQPRGPVDVQSQSQTFAIVPVEAPGQTPAPTPVLLPIPPTHVDIRSQMATLVQNLHYLTGIPDLDSRRISENDGGRLTLSRKRSHRLDSGSNCMSSKVVKLT